MLCEHGVEPVNVWPEEQSPVIRACFYVAMPFLKADEPLYFFLCSAFECILI